MDAFEEADGLRDRRAESALPLDALPLELFEEIELGLIVCDGHGAVGFANQAARRELAGATVLTRSDGRLLQVACSGELAAALRLAAQRGRRSLVRLVGDADRLMVSVQPFGAVRAAGQQVLVMLGRRHPCSELGLEMLAGSYGLTLAERRVLAALVREASPREIALRHEVELSTVRTQIQSIRLKLGARNIEGLLLRAAQVPPMASALRAALGNAPLLAAA